MPKSRYPIGLESVLTPIARYVQHLIHSIQQKKKCKILLISRKMFCHFFFLIQVSLFHFGCCYCALLLQLKIPFEIIKSSVKFERFKNQAFWCHFHISRELLKIFSLRDFATRFDVFIEPLIFVVVCYSLAHHDKHNQLPCILSIFVQSHTHSRARRTGR